MPEMGRPISETQNKLMKVGIKKSPSAIDMDILEKAGGRRVDTMKPAKDPKNMDQNDFLKLLSHQMQNQDPLNPQDSSKYTTDLATFAQLEQLTNMNKKMDLNKSQAMMEQKLAAASFIGKNVVTAGNTVVTEKEGQKAQILFNLERPASQVKVQLMDAKGNLTAEIPMTNVSAGAQQVEWDGKATDGYAAPHGSYQVLVKAWDENSKSVNVATQVTGTVDSVFFESGEPVLVVGGKKVNLRDVDSFHRGDIAGQNYTQQMGAELKQKSEIVNPEIEKIKEYQKALERQGMQGL